MSNANECFEQWFRREMLSYRDEGDMVRTLLAAKENLRTGFVAGFAARHQRSDGGGFMVCGDCKHSQCDGLSHPCRNCTDATPMWQAKEMPTLPQTSESAYHSTKTTQKPSGPPNGEFKAGWPV